MNKFILFVGLMLSVLVSCNNNKGKSKEQVSEIKATHIVNLKVEGMDCSGCEQTIQSGVASLDGVVSVKASHQEKETIVTYNENYISVDKIKAKVALAGYTVEGENIQIIQ